MTIGHANLSIEAHAAAARGISHVSSDGMLAAVDIQAAADSARPSTDDFGRMFGVAWLQAMVVYYGVSFFLHYVVPVLVNPKGVRELGEIQSSSHTRRDAIRALIPVAIRAFMLAAAESLHYKGYGVMSSESLASSLSSPLGLLYVMAMIISLDLFHDTWFYFAHRLLHHRYLMKRVHYMHHQSTVPSAFSGYSFHWIEAVVMFSNAVVEVFIFPIPLMLHRVYELWMISIHVGGHCGFEMFPFVPHMGQLLWVLSGQSKRVRWALNDVHHHDIHHRYPGYHYSLYFTHWDALLGTLHPEWVKKSEREDAAAGDAQELSRKIKATYDERKS